MNRGGSHIGQRPVVDPDRCLGYAFCEARAPKVFVVDGSAISHVRDEFASATEADVPSIEEAIEDCPERAIRWATEEG